ncbi:MAG: DNA internalization-related competence protein ComEC/Rec2 [Deltaproteobacteria bacterium]|nr:DNA internalization-related competence protein ComEC/Rec2 [Deltaproteobacteria bacterium]
MLHRPLVVASGAFLAGALTDVGPLELPRLGLLMAACAFVGVSLVVCVWLARLRHLLTGLVLPLQFFVVGATASGLDTPPRTSLVANEVMEAEVGRVLWVEGIVVKAPERRPEADVFVVDIVGSSSVAGAALRRATGRALVTRPKVITEPQGRGAGWIKRDDRDGRGRVERDGGRDREGARPCGEAGDRIRFRARLRTPRAAMFPGDMSRRAQLGRRGIALVGVMVGGAEGRGCLRTEARAAWGPRIVAEWLRGRMAAAIRATASPGAAGLIAALATGDRSGVSDDDRRAYARAGLSHLLAVSGLHLGIVSGVFVVGLTWLFVRWPRIALGVGARRLAAAVGLPFVVAYALLVGAGPSAVRAAIMLSVALLATLLGRTRDAATTLGLALLAMLVFSPKGVEDVSFQLSFAAVASLMRIYPALEARWAGARLGSIGLGGGGLGGGGLGGGGLGGGGLGGGGLSGGGLSGGGLDGAGVGAGARAGAFFGVFSRLSARTKEVFLASLAATVGTLPVMATHFGEVSIVGLLANIPAVPWASLVVVPSSLLGGLVAAIDPGWARPVLWVASRSAEALSWIAAKAGSFDAAIIAVPRPGALGCVFFYAGVFCLTTRLASRWGRSVRRTGGVLVALFVLSLFRGPSLGWAGSETRVTFLPVGQGDAIVMELPGHKTVVVDTGPMGRGGHDAAERVIVPFLKYRGVQRIDVLVITHAHADHIGGLATLAGSFPVETLWWTGDRREGPKTLLDAAEALAPKRVALDEARLVAGNAVLDILGPVQPAAAYSDVNDGSVVLRLRVGTRSVLLTGDAESVSESELAQKYGEALGADVLKAGHHGSRSSSSEAFLAKVAPRHVVLTVGEGNRFGFPHKEALERIARHGAQVWRTDEDGAVTVTIAEGGKLEVSGYARTRRSSPGTVTHVRLRGSGD